MTQLGNYCKAYVLSQLAEFPAWEENAKPIEKKADDDEHLYGDPEGAESEEDPVVFIHENYTVTKGIYLDQDVIFDNTEENWIRFCKEKLKFAIPEDLQTN